MKVIDAFLFFNELDLLEIRLHEMAPLVDHFVIVESVERFASGKPKAAILRDNWQRVKEFEKKIKYVLLPKLVPPYAGEDSAWAREYYSRNTLLPAVLSVATPDDAVIVSDCDEIPRMSAIKAALPGLSEGIHRLEQRLYHYNVNQLCYGSDTVDHCWDKAVIGTVRQIQQVGGPQAARFVLRDKNPNQRTYLVPRAGWHFTYFNSSVAGIREKIESCCDYCDDQEVAFLKQTPQQALATVAAGTTVRPRTRHSTWRPTDDPVLPEYFLQNQARFRHFTHAHFLDLQKGEHK